MSLRRGGSVVLAPAPSAALPVPAAPRPRGPARRCVGAAGGLSVAVALTLGKFSLRRVLPPVAVGPATP